MIIKRALSFLYCKYRDVSSKYFLKKCAKKKKSNKLKMKVGFVAQFPEVWDKQLPLFEYLLNDSRFEPVIVFVNSYDIKQCRITEDKSEKKFYEKLYGNNIIIEYNQDSSFDLRLFDYLFYDRPYNAYLPLKLRSYKASRYAKICMINYCTRDWKGRFGYKGFARDTSIWFTSNYIDYNLHKIEYIKRPYNRCYDVGYPAFEYYKSLGTNPGKNRILWTPRWTYDADIGGSHFFEYIDLFIDFARTKDVSITIRPHPLMFENLVSKNLLTEDDVKNIMHRCKEAGIVFDSNRIIAETFKKTDILISDYSSILTLFMTTGKPIIYCPNDVPYNEIFGRLMDGMYLANNWNEIGMYTEDLLGGKDILKEKREKIVYDELIRKTNAVERIADILYQDFEKE